MGSTEPSKTENHERGYSSYRFLPVPPFKIKLQGTTKQIKKDRANQ